MAEAFRKKPGAEVVGTPQDSALLETLATAYIRNAQTAAISDPAAVFRKAEDILIKSGTTPPPRIEVPKPVMAAMITAAVNNNFQAFSSALPEDYSNDARILFQFYRAGAAAYMSEWLTGQYKPADEQQRLAILKAGETLTSEESQLGTRYGTESPQANFLKGCGKDLTEQGKEDMLRAALQVGFSLADVSEAARQLGVTQRGDDISQNQIMMGLAREVSTRTRESISKMIDEQKEIEAKQEERDRLAKLYHFSSGSVTAVEKAAIESGIDPVVRTLGAIAMATMELHTGNLNRVVPTRIEREIA